MPFRKIDSSTKAKATVLQQNGHWRPDAIARKASCHLSTAYRWEGRLQRYGQPNLPHSLRKGRSKALCELIKNSLLKFRKRKSWTYQNEMTMFLEKEWNVQVHRSTISRILKKKAITRKKEQGVEQTQSTQLRIVWQADMTRNFVTEQLVFIDESLVSNYRSLMRSSYWFFFAVQASDRLTLHDVWVNWTEDSLIRWYAKRWNLQYTTDVLYERLSVLHWHQKELLQRRRLLQLNEKRLAASLQRFFSFA